MKKIGCKDPKIAVAGINPHAGEGGLFGDEEVRETIPAIEKMKKEGINVSGPISPETILVRANQGRTGAEFYNFQTKL